MDAMTIMDFAESQYWRCNENIHNYFIHFFRYFGFC
jgi:hypothetical protein